MSRLLLRNVTLADPDQIQDILIENTHILKTGASLQEKAEKVMDFHGSLCLPGMVEPHVHLDIALMNDSRVPGRAKSFKFPSELNTDLESKRRSFTRESIEQRAIQAIQMANRHGVTAMRAQCHVDVEVGLKHLEALVSAREKMASNMTLQIVAFPQQGLLTHPGTIMLMREALRQGADVMGCAANLETDPSATFQKHILAAFDLAQEFDVDLDAHADLSVPETLEMHEMEIVFIAEETLRRSYQGRVNAGHLCGLDSAAPETTRAVIELIREARIGVVSQPDMYRLGRTDTMHVRRGLTRVKELLNAGVNVTFASNNVRDALRPMGNFNLLEEGLILAYGAHMDSVEELNTLMKMCTFNAAAMLKLPDYGLQPGNEANLAVMNAPSPSAALIDQAECLLVVKSGRILFERSGINSTINDN